MDTDIAIPKPAVRPSSIPTTMRAAAIDRFGPPEALTLHTVPVPRPGPGEVLLEVHAAGVGVWDASIRDGSWKPAGEPRFPAVLGTDGAGLVAARGPRVRRFAIGERVYACDVVRGGFYAEFVAVKTENAGRVPGHLDLLEAGAAPIPGLTALQGIEALRLRPGETVLVYGASGAVGTLAVQFARLRKARVLGTATGSDAQALVRDLGAEEVLDGRSVDFLDRLRALAPDGLDAVLALADGPALERSLELVRAGGRVAYPNGVEPEPRSRPEVRVTSYNGEAGTRQFARLERAAIEARLRVPIAGVHPLEEAAKAHERMRGHVPGRIVLRIR